MNDRDSTVNTEAENLSPPHFLIRVAEPPKIWLSMGEMKNVVMPDIFRMNVYSKQHEHRAPPPPPLPPLLTCCLCLCNICVQLNNLPTVEAVSVGVYGRCWLNEWPGNFGTGLGSDCGRSSDTLTLVAAAPLLVSCLSPCSVLS